MKTALGLFHFNIQDVAGEPAASHRYCTQVVLPFLRTIDSRPKFRVTFEIAGNGLEFLAENYPESIDLLRKLIAENRVELVSSTYAPTLWVAFPRRDLEHSIKVNQKVLERLGLRASRIFFAQEGFFGPGLEVVSDWFDVAVCKDDTLRMSLNGAAARPAYRLGKLTVIVGANHLLNEVAGSFVRATEEGRSLDFSSFYEAHIQEAINSYSHSPADYIQGKIGGVEWHWYHMGSAHHFTTTGAPQNWEVFFCDPDWMALTTGVFDDLLAGGYEPGFISEFAHRLNNAAIDPLPRVIEGSWNPNRSRGIYVWMGHQEHRWQAGTAILTLAWRARKALRQSELAIENISDPGQRQDLQREIEQIWKQQILAESSDPLGWAPLPCEVTFGREQGDRVLQMCAALTPRLPQRSPQVRPEKRTGTRIADSIVPVELVGSEGNIEWRQLSENSYLCEARFRSEENICGIRFKQEGTCTVYCPTGCEQQPVALALDRFPQPDVYLPLANGFISLGNDLHLIRDNCSVAIAARVSKREPWITFAVEGNTEPRLFEWRFFVVRGRLLDAVQTANQINHT